MLRNLNFILIENLLLDSLKTEIKLLLCTFVVCKRDDTWISNYCIGCNCKYIIQFGCCIC